MMPFIAPKPTQQNADRKMLEPGKYEATCYSVVDLGSEEIERKGEKKMMRKVMIGFEIHGQYIDRDGEKIPVVKSKKYTLSMSEKSNLRKDIKSRYGKDQGEDFDLFQILGKKAELTIIHNTSKTGNDYDVIDYVSMSNHQHQFVNIKQSYCIDEHDDLALNNLYKRQQEIIKKSPEYNQKIKDDLPF